MTQDANTAALNKKERSDASNDAIVDAYQERAITELVDDVMRGDKVAGWHRIDFVDLMLDSGKIRADDITTMLFHNNTRGMLEVRERLITHIEQDAHAWLTDSAAGQQAVSDLCHELAADDAQRHREERTSDE